jgi:hypothetical protein
MAGVGAQVPNNPEKIGAAQGSKILNGCGDDFARLPMFGMNVPCQSSFDAQLSFLYNTHINKTVRPFYPPPTIR